MIRLTIKGGLSVASRELNTRGIPSATMWTSKSDLGGSLTHASVPSQYSEKVVQWYLEQHEVPFPSGTLLLYHYGDSERLGGRKTA
jgi:hypothetical protein